MLSKKDIIDINRSFSNGTVINSSSLDCVVKEQARSRNWLRTAAMFSRAILIDHVFEDGNKRTAAAVIMLLMEMHSLTPDPESIPRIVTEILMKNLASVRQIERCIKDGIR